MPQMFIKPSLGPGGQPLKVRRPDRPQEFLPAEGMLVEQSGYWLRRRKDGSVVEAKPPKAGKAAAATFNKE